jgi:hypothetical protein
MGTTRDLNSDTVNRDTVNSDALVGPAAGAGKSQPAGLVMAEALASPATVAIAAMLFEQVVAELAGLAGIEGVGGPGEGTGQAVDPRTCGYIAGLVAQAALVSGDRPEMVEAEARAEARVRATRAASGHLGFLPQPPAGWTSGAAAHPRARGLRLLAGDLAAEAAPSGGES